jgi:putative hydrolase of the HAD superfamily
VLPKAIFFDLDETLLQDDRAFPIAVASTCIDLAHFDGAVDPHRLRDTYMAVSDGFWRDMAAVLSSSSGMDGQAVRRRLWAQVLEQQGIATSATIDEAAALYAHHRKRGYVAYEDTMTVLTALYRRVRLAVITNGFGDMQREKLQVMEVDSYFDLVLAAGELGIGKPDPGIFRFALDKLGVAPEQVWHVGDSLISDVAGAKAAGLTAVWLNRRGLKREDAQPEPDYEVASLSELLPLLDGDSE